MRKTSERAIRTERAGVAATAARPSSERGAALIVALMAMTVLLALGAALVVITATESIIAGNFSSSRQAFYAAEAAAELTVAELRSRSDWLAIVEGRERSAFADGEPAGLRALPLDAPVDLTTIVNLANCNTPAPCGGAPRWQLFAYGRLTDLAIAPGSGPHFYIVALVAAGQTDSGAPLVTIRAEAFGPRGAHQALEVEVCRTDSGEILVLRSVFV